MTLRELDMRASPYDLAALDRAIPVYEVLPGWNGNISGVRKLEDLPEQARRYVARIQEILTIPVTAIGVGPARDQMILP